MLVVNPVEIYKRRGVTMKPIKFNDLDRAMYKELDRKGSVVIENIARQKRISKIDVLYSFMKLERAGLCEVDKIKTDRYRYYRAERNSE